MSHARIARTWSPDVRPTAAPQGLRGVGGASELPVLHVTGGGGNSNGLRIAVAGLTAAQAELGHPVTLHLSGPDAYDDYLHDDGADAVRIVRSPFTGPPALKYSAPAERWIASPAAAEASVLHQHGIWPAYSRLSIQWRQQVRRPTVIAPHGSLQSVALGYSRWKKSLALAAYERRNLHEASCLHATAEDEVASFRDFGLRNPVAVIGNGTSEHWIASTGNAERFRTAFGLGRERVLLYFSRIHPKKNLAGLVEAVAQLGARLDGWQVVIAGPIQDRGYAAHVRELVRANHLESRVHWIGELHRRAKRDAFAAADLLVLPTLSDNFALVVTEALAVRVPVITTQGALPWYRLEDNRCGWWVPLTTPPLVQALTEALRLPEAELRAMGERGHALVEREFRWRRVAAETSRLYAWLLGRAPRPDFVVVD